MTASRLAVSALTIQLLWLAAGCCSQQIDVPYSWNALEVASLDNSGAAPRQAYGAPVPAAAYGIGMTFTIGTHIATRFSPVPAAYATSCPGIITYLNSDSVLSIRIDAIPNDSSAARDVTSDFRAMRSSYMGSGYVEDLVTIRELIEGMNNDDQAWFENVKLLRTEGLERSPGIRFGVTVELEGGRTLSDTTASLKLI